MAIVKFLSDFDWFATLILDLVFQNQLFAAQCYEMTVGLSYMITAWYFILNPDSVGQEMMERGISTLIFFLLAQILCWKPWH